MIVASNRALVSCQNNIHNILANEKYCNPADKSIINGLIIVDDKLDNITNVLQEMNNQIKKNNNEMNKRIGLLEHHIRNIEYNV
jgi:hypothetical protein